MYCSHSPDVGEGTNYARNRGHQLSSLMAIGQTQNARNPRLGVTDNRSISWTRAIGTVVLGRPRCISRRVMSTSNTSYCTKWYRVVKSWCPPDGSCILKLCPSTAFQMGAPGPNFGWNSRHGTDPLRTGHAWRQTSPMSMALYLGRYAARWLSCVTPRGRRASVSFSLLPGAVT